MRGAGLLVGAALSATLVACSGPLGAPEPPGAPAGASGPAPAGAPSATPTPRALAWGPGEDELAQARQVVAGWTPEQLAGGVLVARYDGTDPRTPAALVAELHLAGVIVMGDNVADAGQVAATAAAVHQAAAADGRSWPAVVSVDQEGGAVARLQSPVATDFPTFMSSGAAIAGARARGEEGPGAAVVVGAASATGLQLRGLGFTWVLAPVADVTAGPQDPTIGSRSPSDDPALASSAVTAAVRGYDTAGIVSVAKHYPGHGSVPADSHETLPVQPATLDQLRARDLLPFAAAAEAGAPAVMMSHIAADAFDAGVPASLSPRAYASLRADAGFDGLAVTDAQDMGAVTGRYGSGGAAVTALRAGADVVLMPLDLRAAHTAVVTALADGSLPRERVEEAAAKVVAVQTWQARTAAEAPVPADAAAGADAASRALSAAAVTVVDGACTGPYAPDGFTVAGGTDADRAALQQAAERAGVRTGSGPTVRLLGATGGGSGGDVVVALDVPYVLEDSRGTTATLALYGRSAGAFDALVEVLTGAAAPQGALPVSIGRTTSTDC